jgi:hypothetical protein
MDKHPKGRVLFGKPGLDATTAARMFISARCATRVRGLLSGFAHRRRDRRGPRCRRTWTRWA